MTGAFGRFLEVSVPSVDVLRSLSFYRELGFTELVTGDIRRWHYAVVTDGCIAIGLHGDGIEEPALAFVRPNLARQVQQLEAAGHRFEFRRLGADQFHEAALRSPDGQLILLMEARTFSPGAADPGAPLLGSCAEVLLGCADADASRRFLESAGFLPLEERPDGLTRLQTAGLTIALRPRRAAAGPVLRFAGQSPAGIRARLEALGIDVVQTGEGNLITAPEGTRILF